MTDRPKRRAMPERVKREVRERQDHVCACGCGWNVVQGDAEYDHRPPLALREIAPDGKDWIPAQHDPAYIDALHSLCHAKRTWGSSKATTLGSDIHAIAKVKRIQAGGRKRKGPKMKSRPFQKPPPGYTHTWGARK